MYFENLSTKCFSCLFNYGDIVTLQQTASEDENIRRFSSNQSSMCSFIVRADVNPNFFRCLFVQSIFYQLIETIILVYSIK